MVKLCFLLLVAYVCMVSGQRSESCPAKIKRSDDCLRHAILIGRKEVKLPRTVADMDSMVCSSLPNDIRCVNEVRPCLKRFPRTIFNVAIKSIKTAISKLYCASEAGKRTIVDSLACVSDQDIPRFFNVIDRITAVSDYIATESAVEDLLPHLCCSVQKGLSDTKVIMDDICGDPKLGTFFLKLMSSMFDDVLDLGCGQYQNTATCFSKFPSLMANVTTVWDRTTKRYETSPIIPLLTLLKRMDA
ncbi:hypothetical protein HDE_10933 [Halotydeus destructor]|nr:hypothetical protein HDE_10933 [Halotydeus destructor]